MSSVRSDDVSLKYLRFSPSDGKDIGIRTFEFVTKTHFLCLSHTVLLEEKQGHRGVQVPD